LGTGFTSGITGHLWPQGYVNFTNCAVSDTASAGIGFRNVASGLHVSYQNISLDNVSSTHFTWPIEISHVGVVTSFPIGLLSITGLRATDKLSRPFLHANAPQNLTLAQGGLREILIEGVVHAESDNAKDQCKPVGIASNAQ
jgi:hypothetical protein